MPHLRDVLNTEKILADVLCFYPCNTVCIGSKFPFQIIFGAKKFLSFFQTLYSWNLWSITSPWYYHGDVILCITKYHTDVILSRLCDSITQTWFSPNWLDYITIEILLVQVGGRPGGGMVGTHWEKGANLSLNWHWSSQLELCLAIYILY